MSSSSGKHMKFKSNLSFKYTYEDFNLSCNNQAKENLHACKECYEDKIGKGVAYSPTLYKPNFNLLLLWWGWCLWRFWFWWVKFLIEIISRSSVLKLFQFPIVIWSYWNMGMGMGMMSIYLHKIKFHIWKKGKFPN